jgi:nitrite reductase/ring-hydroxylating ferredoxin subunit/catechol 2,3-dioxygenase-like lactoylglutathione lyase family enzyme
MALVDGLSHMLVQVTDLDRSEAFYRDNFALEVIGRDLVNEEGPNSLLRTNNGHLILLVQVEKVQPFRPNSNSIHHAFYLTEEQHDAARERRRAAGFDVDDTRVAFRANGQLSFDVFDPDGHRYQVQSIGKAASAIMKADKGVVTCGKVDDFAVGSVTHFKGWQFYLVRHQQGFLAMSHWCTHMNGELVWRENHWSFYCKFHKATFNRKGESTSHHKGYPPLRLQPVTIESDGTVLVDTDKLINRGKFDESQLASVTCEAASAAAGGR